ncbi:MAG: S41 family peptidase [Defluviitaleaceae bacterium]|nr:S41 family peptidase [Defluviitaleaceae bacterium]
MRAAIGKRFFLLFTWAAILIAIVACGTEETTYEPYEPIYEEEYEPQHEYTRIEGELRRIMPHGSLTVQHFLEDLDYMVYVLENNFPLLGVANWAWGIDYRWIIENTRASVAAMREPCEGTFLAHIIFNFNPLVGTGHFSVFTHHTYDIMLENSTMSFMNDLLLQSPLARRFYESPEIRLGYAESIIDWGRFPRNRFFDSPRSNSPPYVTTEIIQEGRIAYISTGWSMGALLEGQFELFNFYRQIRDYEHLIIDMRGNGGGYYVAFFEAVIRPLLTEPVEAPMGYVFFLDGYHVQRVGTASWFFNNLEDFRPIYEVLEAHHLPDFNLSDAERLDYGALAISVLSGNEATIIHPRVTFPPTAFNGKIWLLTDGHNGSAAQLAAWYSAEIGFATHVGETTGGNMGSPRTMALMPNTGIAFYFDVLYLTDSRGRPLEAGTIPHHFNRPAWMR